MKRLAKGVRILWGRLKEQGCPVTFWWAADHLTRIITGVPIRRVSAITPQLHVGGQYRRRGWPALARRGITAVVNMREEFDDAQAGIAPARYLHLSTVDDRPPAMEAIRTGVAFIQDEVARGGSVYIHCGAGVGRAPAMAAAYLVSTGLSADQAWATIRRVRPFIRPHLEQVEQVEQYARELAAAPPAPPDGPGAPGLPCDPPPTSADHPTHPA